VTRVSNEWIKFRVKLATDGRVRSAARATKQKPATILGGLIILWSLADSHADDAGMLRGYNTDDIDELTGIKGFCAALPVDWIEVAADGVLLPNYHEHNGTTAKRRADSNARVAKFRQNGNADVTHGALQIGCKPVTKSVTRTRTRKEQEKKEENTEETPKPPEAGGLPDFGTDVARVAAEPAEPPEMELVVVGLDDRDLPIVESRPKVKPAVIAPAAPKPATGREPDLIFEAIARACRLDYTMPAVAKRIGSVKREIVQAKPPYTPADIDAAAKLHLKQGEFKKAGYHPPKPHELAALLSQIRLGIPKPTVRDEFFEAFGDMTGEWADWYDAGNKGLPRGPEPRKYHPKD
jgi:hypothetical protein